MGQKSNSNFLRSNKKRFLTNKYIEKSLEETTYYPYIDLEVKNFILRFFKLYDIFLVSCKTSLSSFNLKIFISFFISLKTVKNLNTLNLNIYKLKQVNNYKKKRYLVFFFLNKKFILKNLPRKRLFFIRQFKQSYYKNKWIKKKFLIKNSFLLKLMETLKLFTKNLLNIRLVFQKLNKGPSLRLNNVQAQAFRKIILNLRYYFRFNFFKEIVNVLVIILKKKNSINLLTDFIAFQLSILKKHNIFLRFLKQILNSIIYSNISGLKGIKVTVKGRINGVPRSSLKTFSLNELPTQSLDEFVCYGQSTAFTLNGTIGVKVWLFECHT